METKTSWALLSLFVFLAGCTSLQTGGEVQSGRQALLEGRNEPALGYFYSAAQRDPDYVYATGSSPKQGVWSYVGRSEYLTGRFPEARKSLERAIASNRPEDIARLYLGLTLVREGDRQRGLKEIESGMRGIEQLSGQYQSNPAVFYWPVLGPRPGDTLGDSTGLGNDLRQGSRLAKINRRHRVASDTDGTRKRPRSAPGG